MPSMSQGLLMFQLCSSEEVSLAPPLELCPCYRHVLCVCVCECECVHVRMPACLSVWLSVCLSLSVCVCYAGTPSLAAPGTIGAVLERIAKVACLVEGAEVTLEANPTEWQKFKYVTMVYED